MSEVKPSRPNQGLGLYATKLHQPGDVILEESALFTLRPKSKEQWSSIKSQFKESSHKNEKSISKSSKSSSASDVQSIGAIVNIPPSIEKCKQAKFMGLVTAVATYAISKDAVDSSTANGNDGRDERLFSLYKPMHPKSKLKKTNDTYEVNYNKNNAYEDEIVQLATQALSFIQESTISATPLYILSHEKEEECLDVMLIWACNAFKEGYIYDIMSRINHSCDFNAVVTVNATTTTTTTSDDSDKQCIRAACVIQPGDEILISYLGSFTYAGISLRKKILSNDKYFDCQCSRCTNETLNGDIASSIPCINCHERVMGGRYLDEDVQYDDDDENKVYYATPRVIDDKVLYSCHKCGDAVKYSLTPELDTAMEKTIHKVIDHLHLCQNVMNESGDDGDDIISEELADLTERIICLSYSVLGSKHYCTNLLLVQALGKKLSAIHSTMLCNSIEEEKKRGRKSEGQTDSVVDMNDIAECIDVLDRCFNYMQSLGLSSHPAHLIGNVTIGISRVLVGLGDEKSMKFGAEWAHKVVEYFQCGFEGVGMQKVVTTLLNAWKKTGSKDHEETQKRKKIKL